MSRPRIDIGILKERWDFKHPTPTDVGCRERATFESWVRISEHDIHHSCYCGWIEREMQWSVKLRIFSSSLKLNNAFPWSVVSYEAIKGTQYFGINHLPVSRLWILLWRCGILKNMFISILWWGSGTNKTRTVANMKGLNSRWLISAQDWVVTWGKKMKWNKWPKGKITVETREINKHREIPGLWSPI